MYIVYNYEGKPDEIFLCASVETLSLIAVKIDSIVEKEIDNILIQETGLFLNSLCELSYKFLI